MKSDVCVIVLESSLFMSKEAFISHNKIYCLNPAKNRLIKTCVSKTVQNKLQILPIHTRKLCHVVE